MNGYLVVSSQSDPYGKSRCSWLLLNLRFSAAVGSQLAVSPEHLNQTPIAALTWAHNDELSETALKFMILII